MELLSREDVAEQQQLIHALKSVYPEKITAAAFRHRKLADVWKGKVRRLLTGHINVAVLEEGKNTYYQFVESSSER